MVKLSQLQKVRSKFGIFGGTYVDDKFQPIEIAVMHGDYDLIGLG